MNFFDSKFIRPNQDKRDFRKITNALLILASACLASSVPASAESLNSILVNMQGYSYSYVQDQAAWQAENDSPAYSSAPTDTPAYETFTGSFTPTDANIGLAIFSDDGCDVYINGEKVHSMKGQGQHLPDLSQSLHKIDFVLEAGKSYDIKVEYSNTFYRGGSDIDGVSLFFYSKDAGVPGPALIQLRE